MIDWKKYEETTTLELIQLIRNKSDFENAEAAFHSFTFRYSKDIAHKCEIICYKWGYDHLFAAEVVQCVFKKFWKYPNYKHEKSTSKDINKGVLLYLYQIAFTSLVDLIKEKNGIGVSPYSGAEQIVTEFPDFTDIDDERQQIIMKAISSFSAKHKIVYLTYKMYELHGHKLPRALLEKLRRELDLSQSTIRSYKNEVNNKIEEHIQLWKQIKRT